MKSDIKPAELATENATLKSKISELEALVKYYEEQFRLAKHRQFGASSEKSEYDFGQLSLFNEAELFADIKTVEPSLVEIEKHYRQRTRLTTNKLPEDLPVEVVEPFMTESVIKGSFASPEAISHIATQKFVMGVPLYRLPPIE